MLIVETIANHDCFLLLKSPHLSMFAPCSRLPRTVSRSVSFIVKRTFAGFLLIPDHHITSRDGDLLDLVLRRRGRGQFVDHYAYPRTRGSRRTIIQRCQILSSVLSDARYVLTITMTGQRNGF